MGADIGKIAVMPQCRRDVITLLEATEAVSKAIPIPIITMSMASDGLISRMAGEVFGSCITFGSAVEASAPGQIPVGELKASAGDYSPAFIGGILWKIKFRIIRQTMKSIIETPSPQ